MTAPKSAKEIMQKYFFPPPIPKEFEKESCHICGTPFDKEIWDRQIDAALKDLEDLVCKKCKKKIGG